MCDNKGHERVIAKSESIGIHNVLLVQKRPFKNSYSLKDTFKNLPKLFLILSETIINFEKVFEGLLVEILSTTKKLWEV